MSYQTTIAAVRQALTDVFAAVDGWFDRPEELHRFKPSSGGWSIDQILEHVTLTNHFLLLVIRRVVGNYIVDALSSGESVRDAVGSTWLIGTDLLAEVAWATIIYGFVLLVGTVLAGPWGYFRRMRAWLAPNFRDRPEFGWAVLAGLYLLLILWGPVPALRTWLGVIVLGLLIALGFEAFRRVVLGEAETGATQRLEPPPAPAA